MLQPQTRLRSKEVNFKWTDLEQKTFGGFKKIVAHNTVLSCIYFRKQFNMHSYSSYFQLGAFIIQEFRPIK